MEECQQSKAAKSDPITLTLPKQESIAHKRYKGATGTLNTPKTQAKPLKKTPETNIDTQSQTTCPASQAQPNKPNITKRKTKIENVPNVNWENGDENHNAVTVTTRVLPVENPRASLKNEDTQKVEENALPRKNAKGKVQEEGTACYL